MISPLLTSSLLLLFLHHATSHLLSGPRIADANILLPPKMTNPVEYRLQGSDGCFKWSWGHHDIISVFPEYNSSSHCSTSARLRSIAPYGGRKETAIYATDLNSGMMIRCMVYIDTISRIQIFHNSVKLGLDGLATLRVRAFDSEENIFSSLVGLKFMWQLMPESHGLPHSLVHVPLEDSPLSDCSGLCNDLDIQVKLEESGVFSDLYVVKGIEIGHEFVSVSLLEPSVEHLADKIVLTVAEAMSLDPPSPVNVLIGAVVHYTLKVIRSNIPHTVSLPSPFHQWSALNSSVVQVDRKIGIVHALNLGVTTIVVEDNRVVGHMQVSSFHVVLPDNLMLFMSPVSSSRNHIDELKPIHSVSRWYVVAGRQYLIHIKVFSPGPEAQEIFITASDEIELHDNQEIFWKILPYSEGGAKKNIRILEASSYGLGNLTATLAYSSGHDKRKEVLEVVQEVMVCDQVTFITTGDSNVSFRILLPWVPGVHQEMELKASGGCAMSSSDYKWFSSAMDVVSVTVSGTVQAKLPGKATIRAVSIYDPLNYDEVVIEVSIPQSLELLPDFPVETPVGSHLQAFVTLKASNGAYFYACDAFRSAVRWTTDSSSFRVVNSTAIVSDRKVVPHSSSYGPPCAWTNIYASSSGRTMLHATVTRENQLSDYIGREPFVLKVSSSIAAFLPLFVHQASDGNQFGGYSFDMAHSESQYQMSNLDYIYLAPGAHLDVMLHGGPERWGKGVEFIENVQVLAEQSANVKDRVVVHQMSISYGNFYRVGCESMGTFNLVFRRGNLIGEDHNLPVVSEVQLLLICTFPSSIIVIADEALNTPPIIKSASKAERMPGRIRASPVTVANGRRIRISAVGLSDSGKAFANSSSLSLNWELIECVGLALFDNDHSLTVYSSWERFLILRNSSGLCLVRATVVSFIDSLNHFDFNTMSGTSKNTLTDAIQLQLVSSLVLSPEFGLLFFSTEARLNISVTGGSSFLDTVVNDTQIVEVIQQITAHEHSQLILAPKFLGSALVTVHDIGLVPHITASSTVQVAEMDWIKILTGEHISIEEGSFQAINFLVGLADGRTFDPSQYKYMKIRVHFEENIVEVVGNPDLATLANGYVCGPNFTLLATNLGVTTIYLSAIQHSGHEILSHSVKLEVYAPPRIHPGDIFLVPGAAYILTIRGGPTIGSRVQFSSSDDKAAEIHKFLGRLSAISPGNSTIIATIYGDGDIMLCRAYGIVKVGIPSSAILNVQSEQLAVGRSMPIYPSLSDGNLFSFYELCNSFKWTVEDRDVMNFQGVNRAHGTGFPALGLLNGRDLNFIQVLSGISAGRTSIAISFSCNYKLPNLLSKLIYYNASISLPVVPDLPLALGMPITWILPSYYASSDLLPLSSHASIPVDSSRDRGIAYSLLRQRKRKTEEVLDDDIYIDGAKIITKESGNIACIQAKDRSTGRTEVAHCVRVAELAQIGITTNDFPIHLLALGTESDLQIKYYDTLGNPFHEAHNVMLFDVDINYPDVVSIDKYDGHGNIKFRAKSQGLALVRLSFVSNPKKSAYAVISIGPQLYPQNPVIHRGASLMFDVKGLSDSAMGQWFSANESIVFVDKLSGKAEARGEGTTHLHFESPSLKLHTLVTVLKGNVVSVDAPNEVLTNVPFPAKGYPFSVQFSDDYGKSILFLFECAVNPPSVGFSKPWKDHQTGNSYCLFFPYSPENLARSAKKFPKQVLVSVTASLKGDQHISGSASALFIGGFSIVELDRNLLHLNLTRRSNEQVITIVGNTDIELNWNNKNHLSILPIHGEGKYAIRVHGSERFQDQLVFSLPATGQKVEVGVSYNPDEREPAKMSVWSAVCGLLLLILTVLFFICYLDRPARSQHSRSSPIVSSSPSIAAPVTPDRSSPAVVNDQSPRTPQPFMDYVRRTIDETPYYRQDVRRRANHQNTF